MATEDRAAITEKVRATATEFGVDPEIAVRIVGAESSFNPKAIGPVTRSGERARGLMQIMPSTQKELQARYGPDHIRQGVGYYKEMLDMFADVPADQQPYFAAAAYNWGPGHMVRAAKKVREGGGNALNLGDYADLLPTETINYVMKIKGGEGMQSTEQMSVGTTEQLPVQPTQAPQQNASIGQALFKSLANEGERQRAALEEFGSAAKGLVTPTGEATPGQALQASSRAILGGLGALQPVLAPEMTLGGVAGETAARTGAIPVSPETGNLLGSGAAGVATLSPAALRSGMRLVSPSLRNIERVTAAAATKQAAQSSKAVAKVAREIRKDAARPPKLLTPSMKAIVAGGMGAYMGMNPDTIGGAAPYVFGLLTARLGYKAADAIMRSAAGVKAFEALGKLTAGAPGTGRIVSSLMGEVAPTSPRRLQPAS